MHRFYLTLILLFNLAIFFALPVSAAQTDLQCTDGIAEQFAFEKLRPNRTAECDYSFDEFTLYLVALSTEKSIAINVENVEKAFHIPEMTTSYDSKRTADYHMKLSGKGGWWAFLRVQESFYPLEVGQARFEPGPRPKRLYDLQAVDSGVSLSFSADLVGPHPERDSQECILLVRLIKSFANAGWPLPKLIPPLDAGKSGYVFDSGDKKVIFDDCAQHISIAQNRK